MTGMCLRPFHAQNDTDERKPGCTGSHAFVGAWPGRYGPACRVQERPRRGGGTLTPEWGQCPTEERRDRWDYGEENAHGCVPRLAADEGLPPVQGSTALHYGCAKGHEEVVALLLREAPDLASQQVSPRGHIPSA
jgi:hypothetical protein